MPFCLDRKSTRLNSSHLVISYAVFCLKKKKIKNSNITIPLTILYDNLSLKLLLPWCHICSTTIAVAMHIYQRILSYFFFFFLMIRRPPRSTLSLHDALPIYVVGAFVDVHEGGTRAGLGDRLGGGDERDRKSTRLNSSHLVISYAVFCLK